MINEQGEDFIDRFVRFVGQWLLARALNVRARVGGHFVRTAGQPGAPLLLRLGGQFATWLREESEQVATASALRRVRDNWPEIAAGCKVTDLRIVDFHADATGWTFDLELPIGLTTADVQPRLGHLEAGIARTSGNRVKVPPDSARLVRDPDRAERCVLRLVLKDPLRHSQPWAGPSIRSVREPIRLGVTEDGLAVDLVLLPKDGEGLNVLIAGMKGSGKSTILQEIVGNLINANDAVTWVADLKFGVEFRPLRACLGRLETDVDGAAAMVEAALRIVEARGRRLQSRAWHASPEEPELVVLIDEFQALGGMPARKVGNKSMTPMEMLFELARLCRAVGVHVILATQRPSQEALGQGGTGLRGQMDVQIATRVGRSDEVNVVLGPGSVTDGFRPDRFHTEQKGYFLLRGLPEFDRPRPSRCDLVTDAQLAAMARGCGSRPVMVLDDVSAAAAASVALADAEGAEAPPRSREEALRIALEQAPASGRSARELGTELGIPKTWVADRLREWVAAGQAVKVGTSGYRAAPTAGQERDA